MSDATTPYFNPIVIQASPAALGLTLALDRLVRSAEAARQAQLRAINCAGDLGNVQVTYDGTPRPDASDHLIDAYSVVLDHRAEPDALTGKLRLGEQHRIVAAQCRQLRVRAYIGTLSSGAFWYAAYLQSGNEWITGTFDASTGTASQRCRSLWPAVSSSRQRRQREFLDRRRVRFRPLVHLVLHLGDERRLADRQHHPAGVKRRCAAMSAIAIDSSGNLWYVGYDNVETPDMYGGYFKCRRDAPHQIRIRPSRNFRSPATWPTTSRRWRRYQAVARP